MKTPGHDARRDGQDSVDDSIQALDHQHKHNLNAREGEQRPPVDTHLDSDIRSSSSCCCSDRCDRVHSDERRVPQERCKEQTLTEAEAETIPGLEMNRRKPGSDRVSITRMEQNQERASLSASLVEHQDAAAIDELQSTAAMMDGGEDTSHGRASSVSSTTIPAPVTASATLSSRSNFAKKVLVATFLLGFVVFMIVDSMTNKYIQTGLEQFMEWVEHNPISGFFIFVVVYSLSTILFVPGTIPTLGAGYVFSEAFGMGVGVAVGTLAVTIGAVIGGSGSFFVGRFLLREWVQNVLTARFAIFEALDMAIREKGFRIMTLLRFTPIIPFNALNYIAGVTAVQYHEYLAAFWAIIPGTAFYVFLGASAGSLTDSTMTDGSSRTMLVLVVAGVIFGISAVATTSYYARAQLNKVLAERQERDRILQEQADVSQAIELEQQTDNMHAR